MELVLRPVLPKRPKIPKLSPRIRVKLYPLVGNLDLTIQNYLDQGDVEMTRKRMLVITAVIALSMGAVVITQLSAFCLDADHGCG